MSPSSYTFHILSLSSFSSLTSSFQTRTSASGLSDIPAHHLLVYLELVGSLCSVPQQQGQERWPDTWNEGTVPNAKSSSSCTLTGQDGAGLFLSVWELELGFGSLLSTFPLLDGDLIGSKKAFSSMEVTNVSSMVHQGSFSLPSRSRRHKKLTSFSFGKVRKLEEVLSFPQNDLSFIPKVACRTGILNFYCVIDPMENLMKALDSFPEKS